MRQEAQLVEEAAAAADASQAHLGAHLHSARLPRDPQRTQPGAPAARRRLCPGPLSARGGGRRGGKLCDSLSPGGAGVGRSGEQHSGSPRSSSPAN